MQGDRLHATPTVFCLGVGIVVGIRVDVVSVWAALHVRDEFDPGNTDVVRGQKGLPSRNERVLKAWHDLELVARCDRRTGLTWLRDLADVGRAKLETLRGINPNGVEQLTANELDARDERLPRLDVALDEDDAVDGVSVFLEGEGVLLSFAIPGLVVTPPSWWRCRFSGQPRCVRKAINLAAASISRPGSPSIILAAGQPCTSGPNLASR